MADFTLTLKDSYGRTIAKTDNSGGKKVDVIGTKTKTQIGGNDYTRVVAKTTDETTGEEEVATGYVEDEELEQWYEETVSIPSNFAGLEAAMVPTRLRDQLFEITEVNEGDDYVEITALHIFYRQRMNSTTWEPGKTTKYSGAAACRNVMQNVLFDTGFYVASDSTDQILGDELDYARKNIVECFLNPESGICAKYGLSLIRDNDVFYCLKNVGFDRGFVVQSGKNLLGVQRTESIENIITRVAPLGRDADGNLVWMNYEGSNYVDSSHINEYASPRLEILQTDIQVGRDGVTAENIHEKLREKALARFSEDEVDIPEVTMTIEFISLGDTEEYQQYRDLDRVYLYDIVHIKDEARGYSYGAQVIGVRHNILTGRLESCTIGTPQPWDGVRKVAVWRMPEIDGSLIRQNTIRAGKFMEGAIRSDDIGDGQIKADHLSSTGEGNAANAIKRLSLEQLIVENTSPDGLLHTRFAVTEGLIQSEVTRATSAETYMGTRITQNETAITAEASRATSAEENLSGKFTVAADAITAEVTRATSAEGNLSGRLTVAADAITEEVTRATTAEGNLSGRLTVAADAIAAEVTRATAAEGVISGNLTVEAGKISQIVTAVGADGQVTAGSIVLAINQSTGESEAKIDAGHVYIGNEKSTTVISGKLNASDVTADYIKGKIASIANVIMNAVAVTGAIACSGRVSADTIAGATLNVGGNSCTDLIKDASVSGNTLTLTKLSGGTVTFSKAITSASWAWSNGAPVVTLSPQGQSFTGDAVDGVYKRGDPSWASDYKSVRQNLRIDSDSGTTIKNDYIDIDTTAAYNAGSSAGYATGYAAVTVSAAGWVNGSNVVTASNGKSVTVNLPTISLTGGTSFSSHKTTVYASGGGSSGYVASLEVDATSEYNSGSSAGYSSGYSTGYSAGRSDGYTDGYSAGKTDGYSDGYSAGHSAGYAAGKKAGYNEALSDAGVPNGGTVYTGTWRGTLYVAPSVGAQAVNNCVGGASYHTLTKK